MEGSLAYDQTMKSHLKKTVLFALERLAHWRLRKIRPEIIGVTGSVGKTSTKEAIFKVVSCVEPTYRAQKSLNTEFGAMLGILEQESGYSSAGKWIVILVRAFFSTLFLPSAGRQRGAPYKTLILEMGADKPGDIAYLVRHFPPRIGVLTNIKGVHMAEGQFPTLDAIFEEKAKLIRALPHDGVAILNADDPRVEFLASEVEGRCRVVRYGLFADSAVRATDVQSDAKGLRFKVQADGKSAPFHCPYLLGKYHVYVVLPAVAVGLLKGMSLMAIADCLKDFRLPPGRMNRIEGIRGSLILDSSYNASPEATIAALDVLGEMLPSGAGRRIAALGAMNELGTESKAEHWRVGGAVPASADILVTVGKEARHILTGAQEAGMKAAQIHGFETSKSAAEYLKKIVRKGDVILAKGSQNRVRMEYLVYALMLHPEEAKEQLVRQDEYWQENP